MTTALEFTEQQLCELWNQHTALEDDPRNASQDLRVAFEDDDGLRQHMRVALDSVETYHDTHADSPTVRADFHRTRPTRGSAWSLWAHGA